MDTDSGGSPTSELVIIGEPGPELLVLPEDGYVISASDTRRLRGDH